MIFAIIHGFNKKKILLIILSESCNGGTFTNCLTCEAAKFREFDLVN